MRSWVLTAPAALVMVSVDGRAVLGVSLTRLGFTGTKLRFGLELISMPPPSLRSRLVGFRFVRRCILLRRLALFLVRFFDAGRTRLLLKPPLRWPTGDSLEQQRLAFFLACAVFYWLEAVPARRH